MKYAAAWNAVAFQFWAVLLAPCLRIRRHHTAVAGLARHYPAWREQPYRLQIAVTLTLPRRVRALSLPVLPCAVQVVHCSHPAHVFLTGSSATDGS